MKSGFSLDIANMVSRIEASLDDLHNDLVNIQLQAKRDLRVDSLAYTEQCDLQSVETWARISTSDLSELQKNLRKTVDAIRTVVEKHEVAA